MKKWVIIAGLFTLFLTSPTSAFASNSTYTVGRATIVVDSPPLNQRIAPGSLLMVHGSLARSIREPYIVAVLYESRSPDYRRNGRVLSIQHITEFGNATFGGQFRVPMFASQSGEHYTLVLKQGSRNTGIEEVSTPLRVGEVSHGHLAAVLFIRGVQVDRHRAALELQGVQSSVEADQPASFQSFIEMNDLTPGRHTLSESFYGSNGKLLQTYRDQVIANQLAPYNNYDIRNWHVVPTKGSNVLVLYLDGKYLGYGILYGK